MATSKPRRGHEVESLHNAASTEAHAEPHGVLRLPNELLDAVVVYLDQPSLCALVLTCKLTKRSATEALYTAYINRDAPSKAPFHLSLRTLCESSELCAMVKEMDIRGWRSEFEVATGLPWSGVTKTKEGDKVRSSRTGPVFVSTSVSSTTKERPLKLFENTAMKIGLLSVHNTLPVKPLKKTVVVGSTLEKDEDFLRLLRHGVEDAQVILMLALLPGLKRLHIDGMSIYPTLDWHHCLRNSDTALRALRELDLRGNSSSCGCVTHCTTMSFLEHVPNLERLHVSHIDVKDSRQVKELMSNKMLQGFVATDCRIDLQMLQNMLSGHKLVEFRYRPGLGEFTADDVNDFTEDHIVDRLRDSMRSLRKLTLWATRPSQASRLSQFDRLETLEMPFHHGFLNEATGQDSHSIAKLLQKRISRTLSSLTLRFVTPSTTVPETMKVLRDLKLQGRFPELKIIRLNFCRYSRDPWFPPVPYDNLESEALEAFGHIFENTGLQLELSQTD
ncbi:hypothetical protein C7974DRAFT_104282 [Boeremia exigua]|uniref:uncharacterized protein n=1 Tax=Boeremia exigua TaxID=749465 RepID=UPI001E8CBA31|nr:uncharacterized protein C7974DRAFT_104282 [Boeremia exigua]KAH6642549.1 hypothetical protein C7974DRAFT_104282 [Boeremia exigua]